ncbi:hypothetical protein IVA95_32410 [Bradyrhizobium sp. 157]|uniref:hypothetical protein n=1 Tax=Bradyrhizobium sp. 157 TaxID=2782631 RepID=UPI001FFAEB37|nr:hypothetical protein [Bradyrhizobium sp. 157]MCK1642130.1 hypothetical protein [Bradyrhizobium sp. 157]
MGTLAAKVDCALEMLDGLIGQNPFAELAFDRADEAIELLFGRFRPDPRTAPATRSPIVAS